MMFRNLLRLFGVSVVTLCASYAVAILIPTSGDAWSSQVLQVVPLTASTCQANTCQVVDGSGSTVVSWYTETTAPTAVCTYAKYLVNGKVVEESSQTCLSAGKQASATWSQTNSYPAGTVLCTTWSGISGKPCATIEG